ncbi:MAG: hypothetical protein ACLSIL_10240 [Enterococcus casseliflavus]
MKNQPVNSQEAQQRAGGHVTNTIFSVCSGAPLYDHLIDWLAN